MVTVWLADNSIVSNGISFYFQIFGKLWSYEISDPLNISTKVGWYCKYCADIDTCIIFAVLCRCRARTAIWASSDVLICSSGFVDNWNERLVRGSGISDTIVCRFHTSGWLLRLVFVSLWIEIDSKSYSYSWWIFKNLVPFINISCR